MLAERSSLVILTIPAATTACCFLHPYYLPPSLFSHGEQLSQLPSPVLNITAHPHRLNMGPFAFLELLLSQSSPILCLCNRWFQSKGGNFRLSLLDFICLSKPQRRVEEGEAWMLGGPESRVCVEQAADIPKREAVCASVPSVSPAWDCRFPTSQQACCLIHSPIGATCNFSPGKRGRYASR